MSPAARDVAGPTRNLGRAESLAARAHQALKEAIRDGEIEGGVFYSEQRIAERLGISRMPVREAVLDLARAGLLDVVPRQGFRLRKVSEDEQAEIFDLRILLEVHIVRRLAASIDRASLAELREIVRCQSRLTKNSARFLDVDEEFHLRLVELAGLSKAREFLIELRGTIWLLGLAALAEPARSAAVLREHRAVVDGLERHDPHAAGRAMEKHLRLTQESLAPTRRQTGVSARSVRNVSAR